MSKHRKGYRRNFIRSTGTWEDWYGYVNEEYLNKGSLDDILATQASAILLEIGIDLLWVARPIITQITGPTDEYHAAFVHYSGIVREELLDAAAADELAEPIAEFVMVHRPMMIAVIDVLEDVLTSQGRFLNNRTRSILEESRNRLVSAISDMTNDVLLDAGLLHKIHGKCMPVYEAIDAIATHILYAIPRLPDIKAAVLSEGREILSGLEASTLRNALIHRMPNMAYGIGEQYVQLAKYGAPIEFVEEVRDAIGHFLAEKEHGLSWEVNLLHSQLLSVILLEAKLPPGMTKSDVVRSMLATGRWPPGYVEGSEGLAVKDELPLLPMRSDRVTLDTFYRA